jgi:hypothetical protein
MTGELMWVSTSRESPLQQGSQPSWDIDGGGQYSDVEQLSGGEAHLGRATRSRITPQPEVTVAKRKESDFVSLKEDMTQYTRGQRTKTSETYLCPDGRGISW